ncbi:vacuolar amino acid transporter 1-like [Canna indica]|uniref:Vacuolar amino acid transporter 1-like n=1 Tax=Canna indica TaxID=4628 RepID=A0AAQ3KWV1_9LILI|nr:vacuolar amino acid transporter 1-like [Canna indica]
MGTLLFMAPEVARGEDQGPPADIWALGCTVIKMATDRPSWLDVLDPVAAIHRIAFSPFLLHNAEACHCQLMRGKASKQPTSSQLYLISNGIPLKAYVYDSMHSRMPFLLRLASLIIHTQDADLGQRHKRVPMKTDEELGPDRGIEFETDDEENLGHHHGDSEDCHSSSYSSSSSSSHGDHFGGDPSSYQTTWPQSYRASIDVYSSVPSPKVGFLTSSSLIHNSFCKGGSMLSNLEEVQPLTKPLVPSYPSVTGPGPHGSQAVLPSDAPLKSSFAFSSYCELPPPHQCSSAQAVFNGINVLAGVGILSTPFAVKEGGWLGLLLLFALGSTSFYTGILLKRCLDSFPGLKTYPDIGHAAFGVYGRLVISVMSTLILVQGSCVEFITLVGDNLASLFPDANLTFLGVQLSPHQLFAATTALAVLPTVWLKNLNLLSYLSAGGVLATFLVVICLLWVGVVDQVGFRPGGSALNIRDLPVALGLYGFCFSGHSVFPNIYSSMKIPSQFPLVLMICFTLCTLLFAGVAATGYLMFGDSIQSQFTLNMPHQYISSKIAVWTTVVNPLTKYALTLTPVALSLEELLPADKQSNFVMILIRAVLVLSTLVVALTVPFFGAVMALLGSVFTMSVTFIFPCACYLSIKRRSVDLQQVSVCILIIIVGVVCSLIGSFSSISQMINQ